jgi:hypothetical protein
MNNPGDPIAYVFQFADAGSAARDPVVGTYPISNSLVLFDTAKNSVVPLFGYWPVITQPFPLVPALQNHPNIQLIINQTIAVGQPSVIVSNLQDLAFLNIISSTDIWRPVGLALQSQATIDAALGISP